MVVSCWSTGSRALQKYTPQPHTVTNSLCQSDPEWRTMTWAKPSQSPGCDGVAKATKQLTIKKGVGGFVHLVHFFHAKSGRFGDGNTNQQSLRRIASRMKLFHRTFQSIGSQNVNERDRQTDKTRQASQPARQTDRHTDTHTETHTHTHTWLEKHILTIWGVLVAEWTRKKSSSFCNLLSDGCRVLPFSDLQGDDERSDLYFRFKSAESHVRDQCRRLRARVAKVLTLLGVFLEACLHDWQIVSCDALLLAQNHAFVGWLPGGSPKGTDHLRSLLLPAAEWRHGRSPGISFSPSWALFGFLLKQSPLASRMPLLKGTGNFFQAQAGLIPSAFGSAIGQQPM